MDDKLISDYPNGVKRMLVGLPNGAHAEPVVALNENGTSVGDDSAALIAALIAMVHPVWEEVSTGRLRVVLDPLGGGANTCQCDYSRCCNYSRHFNQHGTSWRYSCKQFHL